MDKVGRESGAGRQKTRLERDSMGEIGVPADVYWGAQTARSLIHFRIGSDLMPIEVIRALALVKRAAASVNMALGKLPSNLAGLITSAADEVISGKLDSHFPLSVWQTGSGTQSNMNVNEVISNRAIEFAGGEIGSKSPVHPNDHVNMSHSSNDAFPTAMHIACARVLIDAVIPAVNSLSNSIAARAIKFKDTIKIGRTHLMDATPLMVGQEMSGWASMLDRDVIRIEQAFDGLLDLAIGGTAVGTGLNSPTEFAPRMALELVRLTGLPFRTHPNKFTALSAHDEIVFASGALATLAASLVKIANDIRWLASGPRCGIGEFLIPENEPGSSIMPGKVNPTQCEAITMVAAQVFGAHQTILFAGSQGNFELNVYKPVIVFNFLHASHLIADAVNSFRENLVEGLEIDKVRTQSHVDNSLMLVTALSPKIGYDRAAEVAHAALERGITLRRACIELELLTGEEFDRLVRPAEMTKPG